MQTAKVHYRVGARLVTVGAVVVIVTAVVMIFVPAADDDRVAADDDLGLSGLDSGYHDHDDEYEYVDLDAKDQQALDQQLSRAHDVAFQYPTLADAEAGGYTRLGPFYPGRGTHLVNEESWLNTDGRFNDIDIERPVLIYHGIGPDAPIVGLMYLSMTFDGPEGFVGPNDRWHYHVTDRACVVLGKDNRIESPFGYDNWQVPEEECEAVGGRMWPITGWMVHVWIAPAYESERGVFSRINPKLTCPNGTYYRDAVPGGAVTNDGLREDGPNAEKQSMCLD